LSFPGLDFAVAVAKNRVHLDVAAPAADSSDRAEEIDALRSG